jgi:hypothetical protein
MTYLIVKSEKCNQCHGTGVITHPLWSTFFREHPASDDLSTPEIEHWFGEHGYGPHAIPQEEIECGECEGVGKTRREVPLEEALKSIGIGGISQSIQEALNEGDGVYRP